MKGEALEWVAKADGDFFDAQRGMRARKNQNYDGVCFHCQQCIEKYLKGRLTAAGVIFPKTHDLARSRSRSPGRTKLGAMAIRP